MRTMIPSLHVVSQRHSSFFVSVDNLGGVLGTSRVNVDEDLMMAFQTLRSRGLDTHEECSLKLGHRTWDSH